MPKGSSKGQKISDVDKILGGRPLPKRLREFGERAEKRKSKPKPVSTEFVVAE